MKIKYKTGFQIDHYFYIFNGHESECNDNRKQHFTLIGVKVNYVYRKKDTLYQFVCGIFQSSFADCRAQAKRHIILAD